MRKLAVFNSTTLDGYFTDPNGDISWAHAGSDDPEFKQFIAGNAQGGGTLVFGRITYEMMASYWPTPLASKNDPMVAEGMNKLTKIVFSRTLQETPWSNTRLMKGDLAEEIRKLKQGPGEGMTILGSGSIVSQLTQAGLIDEYQLLVCPIVLGKGRTMFDGIEKKTNLKLVNTRAFANGKVLLSYASMA
ncbi:MAG TPA: dihydrofolate reductase family protein [Rhodothermia bacterium]|nr:dihydrofolate reductase family protein [Rhodothermia bacterium]